LTQDSGTRPQSPDAAVRRLRDEAITLFKRGGELSRVHREGGEKLFWRTDHFVCEEYGDHGNSEQTFTDADVFLDYLWGRWYWKYGGSPGTPDLSDAQAWQKIVEGLDASIHFAKRRPPTPEDAKALDFYRRFRRLKMLWVLGAAIVIVAMALFWKGVGAIVKVQTIGSPSGEAIGTPTAVMMLISKQVPYVPDLHHDPSTDRFDLSLLVQPRQSGAERTLVEVATDHTAGSVQHASKPIGFDGRVAWFYAGGLTGWDTVAENVVTEADVIARNPDLAELWPEAFYEINGGLIASTRDNRIVVRIDAASLVAQRLDRYPPGRRPFPPHPIDSLIIDAEPVEADARDTAWLRAGVDQTELRLESPPGRLLVFRRKTGLTTRMLVVARVDDTGKTRWSVETGIDDLRQVLPDRHYPAFIGARPAAANTVPETIITFVDVASGGVRTESLEFGR
jgi:hypothetical protein